MQDLVVNLENKPGTLAELGAALGNAGINIEGVCGVCGICDCFAERIVPIFG